MQAIRQATSNVHMQRVHESVPPTMRHRLSTQNQQGPEVQTLHMPNLRRR